MKISYDAEVDVLYIEFQPSPPVLRKPVLLVAILLLTMGLTVNLLV